MSLPTIDEINDAENRLGIKFHPHYRQYLLKASDIVFGTIEPAIFTLPGDYTDLLKICDVAWMKYGVPKNLLPICETNADFFCMTETGEVVFWSHNGWTNKKWPNLAAWIEEVWIAESN